MLELTSLVQDTIESPKPPTLPAEVCERILDILECDALSWYFSYERMKTFAACCLTCRDWLPRSRYHLFKQVIVRSKEQVKEVSKLLYSIPALCARVEQLSVYGSKDGKKDASWIGLVGFHLGPKLKALTRINVIGVDFSLMKLDVYKFWGAFNQAWRPDATQKLDLRRCTVTHLNQLIRLASVTKAKSLALASILLNKQVKSPPPVPVLPSGITFPLSEFNIDLSTPDLILPIPWHTLAKQCPSLSSVDITCRYGNLDLSSPHCRTFLVSILCMFHCMQQFNNTNYLRLRIASLPAIEMETRPCHKSTSAANTLTTQPCLYRKLVLFDSHNLQSPIGPFVKVLTLLEDTMALTNYTDRRFHHVGIFGVLRPDSFQSIDDVLSRLSVVTHDVHVTIQETNSPLREECVLPWARERFPTLTSIVTNAFCDPESGRPCGSHPKRANSVKQGVGGGGEMVGDATEVR